MLVLMKVVSPASARYCDQSEARKGKSEILSGNASRLMRHAHPTPHRKQ
jgi:hypothetical protein